MSCAPVGISSLKGYSSKTGSGLALEKPTLEPGETRATEENTLPSEPLGAARSG